MRFKICLIGLVMLLLGFAVGPGFGQEGLLVIVTTTQLEDFVATIGEELVQIHAITPAGICPAHYDLRPSDIEAASRAALVFYHGVEPWLDRLIKVSGNEDVERVQVGVAYTPLEAMERVKLISEALSGIDPGNAERYEENATRLQESIDETATELKEEAQQLRVGEANVIAMKWQQGFVEFLGFNVVAAYAPPETLSMKDFSELVQVGLEEKAALVIDNLQSGIDFGARLAYEVRAVHAILTNFPGAIPHTATYLETIRYNAQQLFEALQTYRG
jgi:zinc transport system substrate-binding protein